LPDALDELGIKHLRFYDRTIFFLPQLIVYILKNKIDLIYGNSISGRSRIGFYASKITKRLFIWHVHESVQENDSRSKLVHLSDGVIANSKDTARRLREFTCVEKLIVVPNGVEMSQFDLDRQTCRDHLRKSLALDQDAIIVINIGRICKQKNQLDVLKIANKVVDEKDDVQFLFLGYFQDQVYLETLRDAIQKTSSPGRFHIMNHTNDFIPILMGCDVLLHTSRTESQGRTILEAMAAKLPVVAYDVGGVGEAVVQGETGLLREFGDIGGMAEDLSLLLASKERRELFGINGFQRVRENFTAEEIALKVRSLIESALRTKEEVFENAN